MREIRTFILLLMGVFLTSCGEKHDLEEQSFSVESKEKKLLNLKFSSANASLASVENFKVYAYVKDTLVASVSGDILNEAKWKIQLPLDEAVTLFASTNFDQITLTDTLSRTHINIGDFGQNEVYASSLVNMVSDNSVDAVHFEMNRIVGQMVFEPTEDQTTLNAVTAFDTVDIAFINVGVSYLPSNSTTVQDTITIRTTKTEGFKAAVYSFPTFTGNFGTLEVIYYKDGQVVNKTLRALDVAINVEASKRSVVYMPILDESYLENTFSKSASVKKQSKTNSVTLKEYQF